jgi:hypothetical protein
MPAKSKKRRTKTTKAEEEEHKRFAPHLKSPAELKNGLFEIEALSASAAPYDDLIDKHACYDLGLALCGAHMMGPLTPTMQIGIFDRPHRKTPIFLRTDDKHPWTGIVKWLDDNVSDFNIRFYRYVEFEFSKGETCEKGDIFGLIKFKGDRNCSLYIHHEVYPKSADAVPDVPKPLAPVDAGPVKVVEAVGDVPKPPAPASISMDISK